MGEKTVLHHFKEKGGTDEKEIPYWNGNETIGDGNCFYNAIMDQIQNNPGVRDTLSDDAKQCSTPSELRAAVINFIELWPPVLNKVETIRHLCNNKSKQSYLEIREFPCWHKWNSNYSS